MILTTHALVGAAIGKYVSNPFLQILILIPLHYVLDSFRHGEYLGKKSTFRDTTWRVTLDLFSGVMIILIIAGFIHASQPVLFSMITGAIISMFPDLLTLLYFKLNFKFLKRIYDLNKFVHSRFPEDSPKRAWTLRNAANDIIFSLIAILALFL